MLRNKIDEFVKPHYVKKADLAKLYYNGKVTEENLDHHAMHDLAKLFYRGKETEKNLENAFYWNQKAAENVEKEWRRT
ncbi:kinase-like domain-containing protein [Rhizophagus irregularis DAOM 181602=DAOM 197198]|nr:kinase-like domain-containing protein [Rhizophagus irregularis DAOM 181602=DAOM 197198]